MSNEPISLDALNGVDAQAFERMMGNIFEHAPWVAAAAAAEGPFATVDKLHQSMVAQVTGAPTETKLALIRNHPELAGNAAAEGAMTPEAHNLCKSVEMTLGSRIDFSCHLQSICKPLR